MDLTKTHGNLKTIFKIVLLSMSIGKSRLTELRNVQAKGVLATRQKPRKRPRHMQGRATLPPKGRNVAPLRLCRGIASLSRTCYDMFLDNYRILSIYVETRRLVFKQVFCS